MGPTTPNLRQETLVIADYEFVKGSSFCFIGNQVMVERG